MSSSGDYTGTGKIVLENSATLVNATLVTPNYSTPINVPSGGTGQSSLVQDAILLGNGTNSVVSSNFFKTGASQYTVEAPASTGASLRLLPSTAAWASYVQASSTSGSILMGVDGQGLANYQPGQALFQLAGTVTDFYWYIGGSQVAKLNISGLQLTNPLPYSSGGTGQSDSLNQNGAIYAQTSGVMKSTNAGTSGTVLCGNTGGAPTFEPVNLSFDVSGTLPVSSGGTGQTAHTLDAVLVGNGGGAIQSSNIVRETGKLVVNSNPNTAGALVLKPTTGGYGTFTQAQNNNSTASVISGLDGLGLANLQPGQAIRQLLGTATDFFWYLGSSLLMRLNSSVLQFGDGTVAARASSGSWTPTLKWLVSDSSGNELGLTENYIGPNYGTATPLIQSGKWQKISNQVTIFFHVKYLVHGLSVGITGGTKFLGLCNLPFKISTEGAVGDFVNTSTLAGSSFPNGIGFGSGIPAPLVGVFPYPYEIYAYEEGYQEDQTAYAYVVVSFVPSSTGVHTYNGYQIPIFTRIQGWCIEPTFPFLSQTCETHGQITNFHVIDTLANYNFEFSGSLTYLTS